MMVRRIAGLAAASAVLAFGGWAQAQTTYNLNLTGSIANEGFAHFDSGGTHYDQGYIALDPFSGPTVMQGDTVDVTVTLDGLFNIPASVGGATFSLLLSGSNFPAINTDTDGGMTLFNGTTSVASDSITTNPGIGTSGQLAMDLGFAGPSTALSFDNLTASLTPIDLSQNATLNNGLIYYTLFSPSAAPEPAAWALMLMGFGGLGAVLRARRNKSFA